VRRKLAAVLVPVLLSTTACWGGADEQAAPPARPGTIDDITVEGGFGQQPRVSFKAPMSFEKTEGEVLEDGPGQGDQVTAQSTITVDYTGINASDGTAYDSTWPDTGPVTFEVDQVIKGFAKGLAGAKAGDRVLLTVTAADGFGDVGNGTSIAKGDSLVYVVDLDKVVNPKPLRESDLPTIQTGDDGDPTMFVPKESTPGDIGLLGSFVLKQGDGAKIKASDTLTVNYLGQVFPDGEVFDESFSKKKPATFALSGVIPGWQQGLLGQQVGSRVVLTIPSDLAYGSQGQGNIPANADLIFVIDVIKAQAA